MSRIVDLKVGAGPPEAALDNSTLSPSPAHCKVITDPIVFKMAAAMVKMPTTARLGAAVPLARPSKVPSLPKASAACPSPPPHPHTPGNINPRRRWPMRWPPPSPFTPPLTPLPAPQQARPALPRRAARGQTLAARAATYICVDCGYIYDESTSFDKLPSSYKCPVCSAPKRRFKTYSGPKGRNDPKAMKARMTELKSAGSSSSGGSGGSGSTAAIAIGGAVLLGALYFVLNGYYQ